MRILVAGASGFIGQRLRLALLRRGHEVIGVGRRVSPDDAPGGRWWQADVTALQVDDWLPVLADVDVVVNCIGIFRESPGHSFEAVHLRAADTLFAACADRRVRRVVQLSALGADDDADTAYHLTKRSADEHLLALPMDAVVAQPSLVFSPEGPSARWFLRLASLPLVPVPGRGEQQLQPIHVDDVVEALCTLAEHAGDGWRGRRVALVGPRPLTLVDYLQALRRAIGLEPARVWRVPQAWVGLAAAFGDHWRGSLLDSASWRMLQRGSTAPPSAITHLLGHAPRAASQFIAPDQAAAVRLQARLPWLTDLLRWAICAVWIITAIVSLGPYPLTESYALLARAGVPEAWQGAALYTAIALDLAFGLLGLALPAWHRRPLWLAQIALILAYTVIITLRLPEYWLHPYGPITKNLPMLAALVLLMVADGQRDRR